MSQNNGDDRTVAWMARRPAEMEWIQSWRKSTCAAGNRDGAVVWADINVLEP